MIINSIASLREAARKSTPEINQIVIDAADVVVRSGWHIRSQVNLHPPAEYIIELPHALKISGVCNSLGEPVSAHLWHQAIPVPSSGQELTELIALAKEVV